MTKPTDIITFGCRLNTYESEVMRQHALEAGLTDAVIINTCAVTAEAERQARQAIRKLRRENPDAKIIVTGCAAQIDAQKYAAMPEVDHVIGNDDKMKAETYRNLRNVMPAKAGIPFTSVTSTNKWDSRLRGNDTRFLGESTPIVRGFEGKWRGFVHVQNGCDHRCTFCVIPLGRGPSRSAPVVAIVEQVKALIAEGYREIVLTGVDIASWGADLPGKPTLGQLARDVLAQVPELPRLRLSSLDPAAMDEDLWQLIANEPRLMPHLHLSVQSGDDMVLKRMKRRHTVADVVKLCERARGLRPHIAFGADMIAGFPTETDEMFANTLRFIEECGFVWLHVFPYSARSGTPAAKMPQVRGEIRKARAAQLRAVGEKAVLRHLDSLICQRLDVLVEQNGLGRTPTYAEVKLPFPAQVGSVISIECVAREGAKLVGRLIDS
jgi:threonylcarbamoyladenosine tRNA methylthiotransferase MtaB